MTLASKSNAMPLKNRLFFDLLAQIMLLSLIIIGYYSNGFLLKSASILLIIWQLSSANNFTKWYKLVDRNWFINWAKLGLLILFPAIFAYSTEVNYSLLFSLFISVLSFIFFYQTFRDYRYLQSRPKSFWDL